MNEYLNKRERWYKTKAVQFELLKAMKDREVVFMDRKDHWKCIRGLYFRSIEYLNKGFEAFKFFEKDYNIYISVGKYSKIPMFTYNLSKRGKETRDWFETEALNKQYTYDYLYDFDSRYKLATGKYENILTTTAHFKKPVYEWISNIDHRNNNILKLIEMLQFPFYIIPSGNNFQIVVENYNNKTPEEIKKIITQQKTELNLKYLDLSGIGHNFKLMKCPYSLVGENVCFPLRYVTKETLENYKYFDCNNILKSETIAYRGIPRITKNLCRVR